MPRSKIVRLKSPQHSLSWRSFGLIVAGLCSAVFAVIFLTGGPRGSEATVFSSDLEQAHFSVCNGPARINCIVDGDTFWYQGRKIRIADINTPETGHARCDTERQLGEAAKSRLSVLMNAGKFTLESIDRDTDKYGRDLRIVTRGGVSLGDALVDEGLAEEWQGYRRDWC